MSKVGFVGLGSMGQVIAMNLLESGYEMKVYNRTPEKAKSLVEKGAILVDHPCDLFDEPGAIVISMLSNDRAIEEIVFGKNGLEKTLQKGCIHLSLSTISPNICKQLAEHHEKKEAFFLAAPVFGLPPVAAARKLTICTSGNAQAKKHVEPILKLLSQKIFDFGDNPIASMIVKLMGNFMILSAAQTMAESFTLGEKYGIDRQSLAAMFSSSLFNCPIYESYGKRVAMSAFEPALFQLSLGLKDMNLLLNAANHAHAIMPFAETLRQGLTSAESMGRGSLDWTAIALFISEGNADAFHTE